MSRPLTVALAIAATLLVALAVLLLVRRDRGTGGAPANRVEAEAPRIEPRPDVSLQVDRRHELTVFRGAPLVLSVRLGNQRALSAAAREEQLPLEIRGIQEAVSRGELTAEQAERQAAHLRRGAEIPVVRLGDEKGSVSRFVRFLVATGDAPPRPLSWPLRLLTATEAKAVALDADSDVELVYALDPAPAAEVPAGVHRLTAVLEVAEAPGLPSDHWRGRVESDPVSLTIAEKPARAGKPEEEEEFHLARARHASATGDLEEAAQSARRALAANPRSVSARILLAETRERQGDLRGALREFEAATAAFHERHPDSPEAPRYLIRKNIELRQKLGLIPGRPGAQTPP